MARFAVDMKEILIEQLSTSKQLCPNLAYSTRGQVGKLTWSSMDVCVPGIYGNPVGNLSVLSSRGHNVIRIKQAQS